MASDHRHGTDDIFQPHLEAILPRQKSTNKYQEQLALHNQQ